MRKLLQRRNNSALALTFRRSSVRRFHLVSRLLLPTSKAVSPCYPATWQNIVLWAECFGVWWLSRQWSRQTSAERCISDISRAGAPFPRRARDMQENAMVRMATLPDPVEKPRPRSGEAVTAHKVNCLKRTGSVVQVRQRGHVVILWDGRASLDAWPPRALRLTIPKPQRMIAVASLVFIESSTTLHAETALGDHLLQQNARPSGRPGRCWA